MPATPLWILLTFLAAAPAHRAPQPARKGSAAQAAHARTAQPTAKPKSNARAKAHVSRATAPSTSKAQKRAASTPTTTRNRRVPATPAASARAKAASGADLARARALLRAVKQDPARRRFKHEWEKAIAALERAAKGPDRPAALLDAARARYALYRFSSDEADRDRALALARKARSAGAADAATFIAAVRREAGDDAPPRRSVATRPPAAAPKPGAKAAKSSEPPAPAGPGTHEPAREPEPAEADEPPDTDPVLDRILAQLAEDPADGAGPTAATPGSAAPAAAPAGSAAPSTAHTDAVLDRLVAQLAGEGPGAAAPTEAAKPLPVPAADATADARPPAPPAAPPPAVATAPSPAPPAFSPSVVVEDGNPGPIRKIVIDPGHGGHDTGAIGPTRVREKDVVLAIARRLARKLKAQGFEVVLTRDDDRYLALAERTALANAHQGDLFVSIHANAHPRRDRQGVETWVLDVSSDRYASRLAARENGILDDADSPLAVRHILADLDAKISVQASRRLARTVQQEVTSGIRQRFGPVRDLGVKSALFYVLLGARMPAVLVETSFISNRAEEKRLASGRFQDEVASAIARAIDTFAAQQQRIAAR